MRGCEGLLVVVKSWKIHDEKGKGCRELALASKKCVRSGEGKDCRELPEIGRSWGIGGHITCDYVCMCGGDVSRNILLLLTRQDAVTIRGVVKIARAQGGKCRSHKLLSRSSEHSESRSDIYCAVVTSRFLNRG
jgi:hypothetical protein